MSPVSGNEIIVKMIEQTNANILSVKEDISSLHKRQDHYHEVFVSRHEFTTTNERILDDMALLVREFKQFTDKLSDNKVEVGEIVLKMELMDKRVKDLEDENKDIKALRKEKFNHKRNFWIAIISSFALVVFEFVKDKLFK